MTLVKFLVDGCDVTCTVTSMTEAKLLKRGELRERLDIKESTLRKMLRNGLPCIRYTQKLVYFKWEDVVAWLEEFKSQRVK